MKLNFRKASFRTKTLNCLKDGKVWEAEELVDEIGARPRLNTRTPIAFVRPIIRDLQAAGIKVMSIKAGHYQMLPRRKAA
jgi:hypothetical protein